MEPLQHLTIKKFHEGLLAKKFSALEVTQAYFTHIKDHDKQIGAYLSTAEGSAAREAEAVDLAIAKQENIPELAGVPFAIKDCILIKDQPATAASKILKDYVASYDATSIQKLKAEKTVFLGKTNMDEFAMGGSTENSAFQLTHNPHDLARVPGGSSGGSAAAVAAHLAMAALGSDTGGSIREPASFCGVVGLKPTYGAVSRSGLIAMTSSMDQIGPIAKTAEDAAIVFKAISGHDPLDATSADHDYRDGLTNPKLEKIKMLRVGLPEEYFVGGVEPEVIAGVTDAVKKMESLGLKVKKISLPHTKYALSAYYIIVPAEISSNLARFDGIRYSRIAGAEAASLTDLYFKQKGAGFGAEAKRRIILGTFVLSSGYYDAYYEKAQRVRTLIKQDFDEAFKEVDVIAAPVTPTTAFKIGERVDDPLSMYLADIFTIPVNLAGLPSLALPIKPYPYPHPAADSKEMPIGFQLIGKKWHEADLLGIGQFYEKLGV